MSYFDYPIDASMLIQKKRKIVKEQSLRSYSVHIKLAVLGGSTTNEIADQIELFLRNYGIDVDIYQSEYGKYWEDAIFGIDELVAFKPDIVYIHTNWRNIQNFPLFSDTADEILTKLINEFDRFKMMWQSLETKIGCPIIQNNFERPDYRLLGNRDIWDEHGRSNFIYSLNNKLYDYARVTKNFYINDIDYLAANYGIDAWNDQTVWYMYKYCLSIKAIPYLAKSVAQIIKSIYGKNKKLIALDLDNTLWGGVIGDDGVDNIKLGPEMPTGQIFADFQEYCKKLKQIGVVLAINSKNDIENALSGLNHPYSVLHEDDFVAIKANWDSKDSNIIKLANELSLGYDSFVFVDDNPVERDIVSKQINGIAVPEIDKPENYIRYIDNSGYFEVTVFSNEDSKKTEMYKAKAAAQKEISAFDNYEDYLDSLQMKVVVAPFCLKNVQRIAQLTNKSNQFNLTTLRCTETDINRIAEDPNWITFSAKLIDKFTDNGIVSIVAGEINDNNLHLRLWLMSCRVLKRTLEYTLMNEVVNRSRERRLDSIIGYYYPTAKNKMVNDFYGEMGFIKIDEDEAGNSIWKIKLSDYCVKNNHMQVVEEKV